MSESLYDYDKRFEEMIAKLLDVFFYPKWAPVDKYNVIREYSKQEQTAGVDVRLKGKDNKKTIIIDEKCAAHYVNSNLKTFAFEILAKEKNYRTKDNEDEDKGWLIKENNKTDLYLLTWVHADEEIFPYNKAGKKTCYFNDEKMTPERIKSLICCIVKKDRILQFLLKDHGFKDEGELEKQARDIKEAPLTDKEREQGYRSKEKNGLKFVYSFGLAEGPVNVLIEMKDLQKLATDKDAQCRCYKVDIPEPEIMKDFNLLDSLK